MGRPCLPTRPCSRFGSAAFALPKGITLSPSGCSSAVERLLPKQDVAGSIPVARSIFFCGARASLPMPHPTVFWVRGDDLVLLVFLLIVLRNGDLRVRDTRFLHVFCCSLLNLHHLACRYFRSVSPVCIRPRRVSRIVNRSYTYTAFWRAKVKQQFYWVFGDDAASKRRRAMTPKRQEVYTR